MCDGPTLNFTFSITAR